MKTKCLSRVWVVVQVQSGVPVVAEAFADRPSAEKREIRLRREMREGYDEVGFFETNVKSLGR
jgi:hypothetical protein